MVKAVIFDLDNTLTDFMRMKEASIEAALDAMIDAGLKISRRAAQERIDAIYREKGIEYQQVFDELLRDEVGHIDPKIHAAGIVGYRKAREATLVPYPHVNLTLTGLAKRGIELGIMSDAPRLQAWLRLCSLQLHHMFDAVVTFEDTGKIKPHPAPFQKVLERLGVAPAEALMIGDWAERDVVGASHLGIPTVFARYGDFFGTKISGADYELLDIIEMLELVDALNAGDEETAGRFRPPAGGMRTSEGPVVVEGAGDGGEGPEGAGAAPGAAARAAEG